jgi:hypothetical protein
MTKYFDPNLSIIFDKKKTRFVIKLLKLFMIILKTAN